MFLSAVSPEFSLALDRGGRLGGKVGSVSPGFSLALDRGGRLGGKVGSVCKKFKTMQQQFWTKKFFLLCP